MVVGWEKVRPAQLNREKSNFSSSYFSPNGGGENVSISVKRTEMSFSGLLTDFDSNRVERTTHAFWSKESQSKLFIEVRNDTYTYP